MTLNCEYYTAGLFKIELDDRRAWASSEYAEELVARASGTRSYLRAASTAKAFQFVLAFDDELRDEFRRELNSSPERHVLRTTVGFDNDFNPASVPWLGPRFPAD